MGWTFCNKRPNEHALPKRYQHSTNRNKSDICDTVIPRITSDCKEVSFDDNTDTTCSDNESTNEGNEYISGDSQSVGDINESTCNNDDDGDEEGEESPLKFPKSLCIQNMISKRYPGHPSQLLPRLKRPSTEGKLKAYWVNYTHSSDISEHQCEEGVVRRGFACFNDLFSRSNNWLLGGSRSM